MGEIAAISYKQLGDTLVLQPALAYLAARSGSPVDLIAPPAFAPLIDLMPGARVPLGNRRYDEAWVFEHGTKAARRAFLTRAREKIAVFLKPAYTKWYHRLVYDRILAELNRREYRGRFFLRLASDGAAPESPPELREPPADWQPAPDLPARFVLANPTSAWEEKAWTPPQWAEALPAIAEAAGCPILLTGGPSERERAHAAAIESAARAAGMARDSLVNLAGRTSLRELLWLAARAAFAVSVDGATAHIAAAFRVPTLSLFGPTKPEHWHCGAPWASYLAAGDFSKSEKRPPLARLPAAAVIERAHAMLGAAAQASASSSPSASR